MIGFDLDVPRSEAVCGVFELLPMTVVVPTSWHTYGTDARDMTGDRTALALPCRESQELSEFDVPVYVAGRLWCPARGVFRHRSG